MNLSVSHCKLLQRIWREIRIEKLKQLEQLFLLSAISNTQMSCFSNGLSISSASSDCQNTGNFLLDLNTSDDSAYSTKNSPSDNISCDSFDELQYIKFNNFAAQNYLINCQRETSTGKHCRLQSLSSQNSVSAISTWNEVIQHDLNQIILGFVDNTIKELKSRQFRARLAEHCRRFGRNIAAAFRGIANNVDQTLRFV